MIVIIISKVTVTTRCTAQLFSFLIKVRTWYKTGSNFLCTYS